MSTDLPAVSELAYEIRRLAVKAALAAGSCRIGSARSSADILA